MKDRRPIEKVIKLLSNTSWGLETLIEDTIKDKKVTKIVRKELPGDGHSAKLFFVS